MCYTVSAFPLNLQKTLFSVLLFPNQVASYVGDSSKGIGFAFTLIASGLVALFLVPFLGSWSDRTRSRFGKRRPWIVPFSLVNIVSVFVLSVCPDLISFAAVAMVNGVSQIGLFSIFPAIVGDLVPNSQQGTANAWMVFFENLGSFVGCFIGIFGSALILPKSSNTFFFWSYFIVGSTMLATLVVTVIFVRETSTRGAVNQNAKCCVLSDTKAILLSSKFLLLSVTAMLSLGLIQSILQDYFQYFVDDNIPLPTIIFGFISIPNSMIASSAFLLTNFTGGIIAIFVAPFSDRSSGIRVLLLVLGFVLQVPMPLVLMFASSNLNWIMGIGLLYGFAGSIVRAVSMGSLQIVLKDIGTNVIGLGNGLFVLISFPLPLLLTLLDGWIVDHFRSLNIAFEGYSILFWLAFGYILVGIICTLVLSRKWTKVDAEPKKAEWPDPNAKKS